MLKHVMKFLKDEEGASAVEYGLIAGLIAVVLIAVIATLNDGFKDVFDNISTALSSAK